MVNAVRKILLTEPKDFPSNALHLLEGMGHVVRGPFERQELERHIADADIIFVRLAHNIDRNLLDRAQNLKTIVTATTGLTHIDLEHATAKGITVLSLKGETQFLETISPTADLTFGLILSLYRNIPAASAHVKRGAWNRDLFKGYDLDGKTLGIYGFGRIGAKVAKMGKAFGMKIVAYDTQPRKADGINFVDEATLLAQADIVSLHVPHENHLRHFFDDGKFSSMKDGARFINTARGELVHEGALLKALETKKLSGAALDVLDGEYGASDLWLSSHPLINYASHNDNLIITPHIGGASYDSMERVESFMVEKLLNHMGIS